MAEYLDFFNIYILGVMETFFQLYFLAKILKKKMWTPFYFLFAVGSVITNEFIVNSLMSLQYPWLPAFFHEAGNIAVMLICEAASSLLSVFCYCIVYRYFSRDDLYPVDALCPADAPDTAIGTPFQSWADAVHVFSGTCQPVLYLVFL